MVETIKKRLDDYLEFDSNDLFKNTSLVRIFGGAIRDSLCGDEIHDIDILTGSNSHWILESVLRKNGYNYIESLTPKDLSSVYTNIKIINEPHSWVNGTKVVQLIRPATGYKKSESEYIESFNDLIRNVDISCCGVSYNGYNLYENCPNSIIQCINKVFFVNTKAKMLTNRIVHRKNKFYDRGWKEIESNTQDIRDLKINNVLSNKGIVFSNNDYIIEWQGKPSLV